MNSMNNPLYAATAFRGLAASLAGVLVSSVAGAQPSPAEDLKVGRSVMRVPQGVRVEGVPLSDRAIAGDGNIRAKRALVRVTPASANMPSYLLIENVAAGGGRFEWSESCKSIRRAANVFVHSPINTSRDYCVIAQGPFDLKSTLDRLNSEAGRAAVQQQWPVDGEGYVISASFALASGAYMKVQALVPQPFAGLPVTEPLPEHTSQVPESVIAWAMSLGQETQTSALSLSGKWQLPPIKQP
jgi:hypothetical protein